MTESLNLEYLCKQCVNIARDAGSKILDIYNSGFEIEKKADNTPLTDADMAAHHAITTGLGLLTPEIPILSEESEIPPYEIRRQWETYWLVDPLDGTREFIKRNGEFTVNIALIQAHEAIIGVVHVPVLQQDYYAWNNGGAYKISNSSEPQAIKVKKLDAEELVVAGSRSHGTAEMQAYVNRLRNPKLLRMGSSLKLCLVAEGTADLYPRLGPTAEWDTAASHCIIEQAGGYVTTTDMSPLKYNTRDSLRNPFFFAFGDASEDWSRYLESSEGRID